MRKKLEWDGQNKIGNHFSLHKHQRLRQLAIVKVLKEFLLKGNRWSLVTPPFAAPSHILPTLPPSSLARVAGKENLESAIWSQKLPYTTYKCLNTPPQKKRKKSRRQQTLSKSIYKLAENSWQQNSLSALSSGSKQSCLKVPSCQYQVWQKYPWHGRDLLWEQEYWKSWIVTIFQGTDKSQLPRQHWQMNYTKKNHF